ncbi:hypothetical protein ACSTB0_13455, partial [Faecalibacterium wellingii]|uniref:hypothetical protein n=1 Tax=Faecalibacterium wellingii TaxID=2929491 RepID=UPI003EDB530B
ESVRSRKIKVNYHDSTTSFLEGVFAKGDRRLAPVIVEAYKRGLSLPSLRVDNFSQSLIEKTTKVRKSGLTFAAEAGTQRLRNV